MSLGLMVLQGVVFGVWAWHAFAVLFELRRRGVARTGLAFFGLRASLEAVGAWARDPGSRAARWRLIGLTALLMAMSVLQAGLGR